jgi:hypothetical protein
LKYNLLAEAQVLKVIVVEGVRSRLSLNIPTRAAYFTTVVVDIEESGPGTYSLDILLQSLTGSAGGRRITASRTAGSLARWRLGFQGFWCTWGIEWVIK